MLADVLRLVARRRAHFYRMPMIMTIPHAASEALSKCHQADDTEDLYLSRLQGRLDEIKHAKAAHHDWPK